MLGVPEIFYRGYLGSGVKLALFDTGIKLKHTAVKGIRITRQFDFLSGDNFYTSGVLPSHLRKFPRCAIPDWLKTRR
jgi:subtilisin family serine protease